MTKTNFLVGMGIGVAVGSLAGMTVSGAKKPPKNIVGKTLKTMGEVVDAVSSSIGLFHAESQRREAVGDEIYPQKMHGL